LKIDLRVFFPFLSSGFFLPISDLYKSLIFLSWIFSIIHMVPYFKKHKNYLSIITAPNTFFTQGFATWGLLTDMHQSKILHTWSKSLQVNPV
jgi:ABC-type transport system involved in cytochrome c biogenesis permease subunit